MKNYEAIKLLQFLTSPDAAKVAFTEVKSYFQFKRNIKALDEFVKTASDLEKEYKTPSDKFKEYESKKLEQLTPYLKKDEDGKLITNPDGSNPVIEGTESMINAVFTALNAEYRETLEERLSKLREWEKFLQLDADMELFMIPASTFKLNDDFTALQFDAISLMLDEDA